MFGGTTGAMVVGEQATVSFNTPSVTTTFDVDFAHADTYADGHSLLFVSLTPDRFIRRPASAGESVTKFAWHIDHSGSRAAAIVPDHRVGSNAHRDTEHFS